mmetsp:Transcript_53053/g.95492  ORF Transcript_53053/g.95492 Transcript_53053/m.95492 type:complete len:235 (+) Transcript_53053:1427-2131(+)
MQAGVKDLDASVAEATENRKAEHEEFEELKASDSEAVDLLGIARDRLNKFYSPSLAPASEPTSDEAASFVQIEAHSFVGENERAPEAVEIGTPPSTGRDFKKKGEESNGIIHMIEVMANHLEQEMAIAKTEEQNNQEDYQKTMQDAQDKREADMAAMAENSKAMAEFEADKTQEQSEMDPETKELDANEAYTLHLHQECDWLLKNFYLRKAARSEEQESLGRAKAVLAGADFGC